MLLGPSRTRAENHWGSQWPWGLPKPKVVVLLRLYRLMMTCSGGYKYRGVDRSRWLQRC